MDRYVQFAVAAAMEAVADAGLDLDAGRPRAAGGHARAAPSAGRWCSSATTSSSRTAARSGSSTTSTRRRSSTTRSCRARWRAEVALKFGAHGPSVVVSTGCTSGIDAIGYGHQLIQDGEADIVISGASETPISPISMACFDPIKATSRRNDDPEHASRPFDRDRDGFVMGEGSAVLVLEEFEAAQARGAHIYCEVAGFANRGNAYHMTGLRPDGARDGRGDPRRDGAGRHRARGHRLHQRARLGDEAERPPRDRRVQALARRPGLQDPDQLDQVDDRPLARRRSARSRWPPARSRSTAASSRRPRTGRTPTPSATSTTRRSEARRRQVDAALSTGSGFGGFQSAMILARPKELQEVGI